ncbi:MAG: hypothetical protein KC486_07185 [Myxococcales bacterium]|nr:hypothetical protein [Myxococcales bacterium]
MPRLAPVRVAARLGAALPLSLSLSLGLAGCGDLVAVGDSEGTAGGGVPAAVEFAFAEACATAGCHDAATRAAGLSLAGADLDAIVDGPSSAGVPMVTIGDVAGSYLAIKMLPDDVLSAQGLERVGGRMPPTGDFTSANNQTILAWIAGAEFPDEGGTDTTGDSGTSSGSGGSGGTGTGDDATFDADVWPILEMRCSCHFGGADEALNGGLSFPMDSAYAALVDAPSIDVPSMDLVEPNDPDNSYLLHKLKGTQGEVGGAGVQMPTGSALESGEIKLIEGWIAAGAPE